jgi:hypothetical protein
MYVSRQGGEGRQHNRITVKSSHRHIYIHVVSLSSLPPLAREQ